MKRSDRSKLEEMYRSIPAYLFLRYIAKPYAAGVCVATRAAAFLMLCLLQAGLTGCWMSSGGGAISRTTSDWLHGEPVPGGGSPTLQIVGIGLIITAVVLFALSFSTIGKRLNGGLIVGAFLAGISAIVINAVLSLITPLVGLLAGAAILALALVSRHSHIIMETVEHALNPSSPNADPSRKEDSKPEGRRKVNEKT